MSDKGGSAARARERNRELAAYLRKLGVERLTGMCPAGCGRPVKVGGKALLEHLPLCPGPRRKCSF